MINYIKYRRALSVLEKEQNKNDYDFKVVLDKAKSNNKSSDEIDAIQSEYRFYHFQYEGDISTLTSTYYLKEARKNLIPIPDYSSELWEKIEYRKVLTVDGVNKIRTELRKNKKEVTEIYFPYLTLLVGIIGALTGFVAVILK